jgi:DNA helicase-2/ATP-dependent DNA helicase PcrA
VENYKKALTSLNPKQREAVEQIDGPVLVIAGPGTGKTQLLSTRVGYILQKTDALPRNILALTFTEAGVASMRERLTGFLGQDAYDVNISTYHAFGSDLLRRYPEYANSYDFEPIDDLGSDSLIREILEATPYANPLKSARTYAYDLRSFISDSKRALLTPDDLKATVKANMVFIEASSKIVAETLKDFVRIGKDSPQLFSRLHSSLQDLKSTGAADLSALCLGELETALEEAQTSGKTKSITKWKNDWLAKNEAGQFILDGKQANLKIAAAADIYEAYQKELAGRKLYDYDDMILRAIKALETHADFKFTLAEQYQYILLDEFQDTNAAQLRIVELMTDNPVHEGRPNVLAVGDDDQAIYAFQGADHTNMFRFSQMYRDAKVISLGDNYRSHEQILEVAHSISSQIDQRLHEQFEGVDKVLSTAAKGLPAKASIAHHQFVSDAAQYAWAAKQIKELVEKEEIEPNEIAVLAPKHKYLVPFLPYLAEQALPVRYQKRENVLDKPVTRQLEQMSHLVLALSGKDQQAIDSLWPEVLSYDFWDLPTELIWDLSWQANGSKKGWTNTLLGIDETKDIAKFFLRTADLLATTNLEQQLDILIGVSVEDVKSYKLPIRCPFYEFYFGGEKSKNTDYLELLSDLSVLRGRLRTWRRNETSPLNLQDFLQFTQAHRSSGINILNSSPHHEAQNAVNVMTAYQAKGREFQAVFILAAQDEVWGSSSREQGSTISLPPNLQFIRYRGGSDDERLRLLYVAITRAKTHLYLTNFAKTLDGKTTRPLKYLAGQEAIFPAAITHDGEPLSLEVLEAYWHSRHVPPFEAKLRDLLEPQLEKYQLSPTHLNQFIDVVYSGPEAFFLNSILRFPKGQSPSAQYGTAVHDTLRWTHDTLARDGKLPGLKRILAFFDERMVLRRLPQQDLELLQERGHRALKEYMTARADSFNPGDKFELSFRNEGVFSGQAHLAGKIDKLRMDKATKTITVTDFKTGPSYTKWDGSNITLHKYRQQLMIYKLLIERSHSFAGWKVREGVLEFVEPSPGDGLVPPLKLEFNEAEVADLEKLIQAVWEHIQNLDFPDIRKYPPTISGVRAFEADLLK